MLSMFKHYRVNWGGGGGGGGDINTEKEKTIYPLNTSYRGYNQVVMDHNHSALNI